ncbi:MAG: hypothetical protein QG626_544 [Patescibacteria group bacterium]|jgi:hypothetical protein|nr:hypothetical protein [Patescibacteria group bacterium]
MHKFTKSKLLGAFVVAGTLFGSGVFAASIFSANAEPWFASKCVAGARGPVAAVCDLHERVVVLENTPDVTALKQLIVRDADGEYVGALVDGLPSRGTAYNEMSGQFLKYDNDGDLLGEGPKYIKFSTSDCSGQGYFESEHLKGVIYYSGSSASAFAYYAYMGNGSDGILLNSHSYYANGVVGCQLGGGSSAYMSYPATEVIWPGSLDGPFSAQLE